VKNDVNTRVTVSDSHRNASRRPEDTDGADSDIRRGVRAVVSEIEGNATSTLHRITVQGQEGSGSEYPSVSECRAPAVAE